MDTCHPFSECVPQIPKFQATINIQVLYRAVITEKCPITSCNQLSKEPQACIYENPKSTSYSQNLLKQCERTCLGQHKRLTGKV